MPNKQPDVWATIWAWIVYFVCTYREQLIYILLVGGSITARALMDDKRDSPKSILLDMGLCIAVVYGVNPTLVHLGVHNDFMPLISIAIGYLGSTTIRNLLLALLTKLTGGTYIPNSYNQYNGGNYERDINDYSDHVGVDHSSDLQTAQRDQADDRNGGNL